jgi:hypothetical protein
MQATRSAARVGRSPGQSLEPAIQSARNWLEIAAALHLINSLVLCAATAVYLASARAPRQSPVL